jgi:hypothetical protein
MADLIAAADILKEYVITIVVRFRLCCEAPSCAVESLPVVLLSI